MGKPEATAGPSTGTPAAPSPQADCDKAVDPGVDDEAARLLRGGPGEPHAGARPGQPDQAGRQGFDRQRGEPQNQPPADVRDAGNIAGDKDFELQPPPA